MFLTLLQESRRTQVTSKGEGNSDCNQKYYAYKLCTCPESETLPMIVPLGWPHQDTCVSTGFTSTSKLETAHCVAPLAETKSSNTSNVIFMKLLNNRQQTGQNPGEQLCVLQTQQASANSTKMLTSHNHAAREVHRV